jgi:hypothetical protein
MVTMPSNGRSCANFEASASDEGGWRRVHHQHRLVGGHQSPFRQRGLWHQQSRHPGSSTTVRMNLKVQ